MMDAALVEPLVGGDERIEGKQEHSGEGKSVGETRAICHAMFNGRGGTRIPPQPLMGVDTTTIAVVHSPQTLMGLTNTPSDLLPGTLELLILKALAGGPRHGYGIVERLRVASADVLNIGESALYPALQRLLINGWVKAEWGTSENNRRARYYQLTAAGKKQLAAEHEEFERMVGAIRNVLAAI